MRKPLIAASIAFALLASLALAGPAMAAPTIKLGDNFFKPAKKTVRKGAKVKFRWIGFNPHNVVKTRGPGGPIRSRTTSRRGVNFAKRFRKRGVYRFVCTIHPTEMRLKLVVR